MSVFEYRNAELHIENVSLQTLAEKHATPLYVYSRKSIETQYKAFDDAFGDHPHRVCYAVKANSNLAVLNVLARLGAGFDIVSVGELERVLKAGGKPENVVFSGVAKQAHEIERALKLGIHCFNVESEAELERINDVATALNMQAPISLRVNPDVDAKTHPYISTGLKDNKFGIDINVAEDVYVRAAGMAGIRVTGVDCHIGSQLTELSPFVDALDRVLALIDKLATHNIELEHIDIGGGLGICYDDEVPPSQQAYADAVMERLLAHPIGKNLQVCMEPGRAIVGNSGVLLTTVEFLKPLPHHNFAIVDGAMNDLLRPSLYSAWQEIKTVKQRTDTDAMTWDIVGPVCETGDFLGKERKLAIQAGDVLSVMSSGAYGFVMASTYNSRPKVAEIMVDGDQDYVIRKRETIEELTAGESILPE